MILVDSSEFLVLHTAHFDNIIVLPLLVFETIGLMLFVFFCILDNKITLFLLFPSSFFKETALKKNITIKWNLA